MKSLSIFKQSVIIFLKLWLVSKTLHIFAQQVCLVPKKLNADTLIQSKFRQTTIFYAHKTLKAQIINDMKISYSNLHGLNRWELFQFLADVLAYTEYHEEEMPELLTNKLAEVRTAFNAYDEALVQEQKASPEVLYKAEEERDYAVRKLYSIIKEYSDYAFDKTKEDAAIGLLQVFKPYGTGSEIAKMAQDAETAVIVNLIQDFEKAAPSGHLRLLGLMDGVETLELANVDFTVAQRRRTNEQMQALTGVVKAARDDAQTKFIEFVDVVNALAIVEGQEKYADLKQAINGILKKYVDRAKQRTKKKEDENPEEVI